MLVIVRIFLMCAMLALSGTAAFAAPPQIGIVLMHGTAGVPLGTAGKGGRVTGGGLVASLRKAGYRVETPEMCWSERRIYDRPYSDCFGDVDAAIARLRAAGATAIVVGGLSMGGNAAIAYAATHTGLLGVIACAPAHDALSYVSKPAIIAALAQAKSQVAAGSGDRVQTFPDFDGSKRPPEFSVRASPAAYVSFFDIAGLGNIEGNLGNISVPIIWVAGTQDATQIGSEAEFARIPDNPLSKYVRVNAQHLETPDAGASAIVEWLNALGAGQGS
ncbi:MAG TPA: alpha/beta hydrolase [Candidatus Lustribacter sp.]|nr:alpha/beta hydrolase [Candidatus Lustribacter sp.]